MIYLKYLAYRFKYLFKPQYYAPQNIVVEVFDKAPPKNFDHFKKIKELGIKNVVYYGQKFSVEYRPKSNPFKKEWWE